jgi:hypothetical protein
MRIFRVAHCKLESVLMLGGAAHENTMHSNKIINSNEVVGTVNEAQDENESIEATDVRPDQHESTKPPPNEQENNDPFSSMMK